MKEVERATSTGNKLTPQAATVYRALSARCNYLAQDRPDVAFAAKELCRDFSAPTPESLSKLTRAIRYLKGCPRLVYCFPWQADPKCLTLCVDTDFAGCRITRRATSGGAALRGQHCIRHWSTTQATIALSSGEAELGEGASRRGSAKAWG